MKRKLAVEFLDWMGVLLVVCVLALSIGGGGADVEAEAVAATYSEDQPLVVVDAGHGGADGGAVGIQSGMKEDGINLAVAKLVEAGLREAGCNVVMTREDENALADTKNGDMQKRREIMRQDGVDLVVSVHMNKFNDRSVRGPMAFYMKGSSEGERLATSVIESVCEAIGNSKRPANPGDYFVIRESIAPAVIIECGFLSNSEDEVLLQDPAHQKKLAEGIVGGVMAYLNAPKANSPTPLPSATPAA